MNTYAFVLDLERSGAVPGGWVPHIADGLDREVAFEQAGPGD
jgi:hypothetical protein